MLPFQGFLTRAREAVTAGIAGRFVLIEMIALVLFGLIVSLAFRSSLASRTSVRASTYEATRHRVNSLGPIDYRTVIRLVHRGLRILDFAFRTPLLATIMHIWT